ncbi:MAG TPA: DNA-deoxyinosine glycosylase [Noviherbaspirillum sp.]
MLTGLPPVLDADTRTLILGSFPGRASLDAGQYYAHPRNQFWRLLGAVLQENLAALAYPERLARLRVNRVGLWDVLDSCERAGSLDSAIRNARANNFDLLHTLTPALQRVCFNGRTAARHAQAFAAAGFDILVLPSSSPAHASLSFEDKLAQWRGILG